MTPKYPILYQPNWLAQRFASGASTREISDQVGCSTSTVRTAAHRLNAQPPQRPGKVHKLRDIDWLKAQLDAGRTQRSLAVELGCSKTTVSKIVRATFGDHYETRHPHLYDPAWLTTQLQNHRTHRQMAADANCSPKAIRDALDRYHLR